MRPIQTAFEILPRISVLIVILPLLININVYAALLSRVPAIIARGGLDIASYPLLIFASLVTGVAAFISPSPSMLALAIFFMALADPRLLLASGLYSLIISLSIVLLADVVRGIYKSSGGFSIELEHNIRTTIKGFTALALVMLAVPALFSALVASYIFSFKLYAQSPYVEPIASFLNSNPAGSIVLASIILAVFYVIARHAVEVSILYAIPSPRLAVAELSTVARIAWVRPSLGFLRGFIASALMTPPIYYIVRAAVEKLGVWGGSPSDIGASIAQGGLGVALFAVVWAIASRGLFTEEREPGIRGIAYIASAAAAVYVLSVAAGYPLLGPGTLGSGSLDRFLAPVTQYYKDLWVMAELLIRAVGGAP